MNKEEIMEALKVLQPKELKAFEEINSKENNQGRMFFHTQTVTSSNKEDTKELLERLLEIAFIQAGVYTKDEIGLDRFQNDVRGYAYRVRPDIYKNLNGE